MSEIWNLSSLCRCCHSDGTFKSLYLSYEVKGQREQYALMLKDTFDIVMDKAPPNASTMVCDDCIYELKKATRFKEQVLDCERKFAEYCLNEQTNQMDVKIECESEDNSDGDRALRKKDSELENTCRDAGKSERGGKKRRVRMSRKEIEADTDVDAISTVSIDDDMGNDITDCHDSNNATDKRRFPNNPKRVTEEPKSKAPMSQIDSSILSLLLAKMDMLVESSRTQHERTMESIRTLQEGQKEMQDTQQAIMQNLSKNETQIKQLRSESDTRIPTTALVKTAEDLKRLENLLADPAKDEELRKKYSVICGVGKGRGINNAYSLIDAIFERSFLYKCSWSGGSRTSESKICFKSCTNVINFFFRLIHMSDRSFTMVDCHQFLKMILRNSRKRCESLKLRRSTIRNRVKKRRDVVSEGKMEPHEAIDMLFEATVQSPEAVQSDAQADDAWSEHLF